MTLTIIKLFFTNLMLKYTVLKSLNFIYIITLNRIN